MKVALALTVRRIMNERKTSVSKILRETETYLSMRNSAVDASGPNSIINARVLSFLPREDRKNRTETHLDRVLDRLQKIVRVTEKAAAHDDVFIRQL